MNEQMIGQQPKKKLHIATRLVCLLLAIVIWFIVAGVQGDNFKREVNGVEVVLIGADALSGYEVTGYTETLTVRVKGDRSKVLEIDKEDIFVEVDVSAIKGAGTLKVPAVVRLSPKLEGIVPYGEYTVEVRIALKQSTDDTENK